MSDSGGTIESYNYLGLGTIVREIRPGSVLTYVKPSGASNGDAGDMYTGLDRFGRVVNQLWTTSDTPGSSGDTLGTITDQFQYAYDQDSNVLYKNNMVHSAASELYHANGTSESTAYDPLNRLTAFSRGTLSVGLDSISSPSTTNSWSLDALGNSTNTGGTSRTFNSKNQIATYGGSSGITYDHDGNMTTDQAGTTYTFDPWNRLISALPHGIYSQGEVYSYNAIGERPGLSLNICNGAVTSSYYSTQWQDLEDDVTTYPCGPVTTKSTYLWSISYIDDLIARDTGSTRVYAQQDANHNITSLTNSSGTVLERFVYDPYGARTVLSAGWSSASDSQNWVYGFQGGRLDPISGLVNFRNRDLNPTTGTWMEQDPARYLDGSNVYEFTHDSPAALCDPLGLSAGMIMLWPDVPTVNLPYTGRQGNAQPLPRAFTDPPEEGKPCPCMKYKSAKTATVVRTDTGEQDVLLSGSWRYATVLNLSANVTFTGDPYDVQIEWTTCMRIDGTSGWIPGSSGATGTSFEVFHGIGSAGMYITTFNVSWLSCEGGRWVRRTTTKGVGWYKNFFGSWHTGNY